MDFYLEIILNDKIYSQRTPISKFIEFSLDGTKLNTYDTLPYQIKKIVEETKEIEKNPSKYFDYYIKDNEVIIEKLLKNTDTFLKIPEYIEGLPVVELATRFATYDYVHLNQMQLPCTLKRLNEYTFQSIDIGYINLPSSITEIPRKCFFDSTIKSIDLSYVKYIGENAFDNCNNLKKVDISNVKEIDTGAFSHCSQLISVVLPNNLSIISSYLFYDSYNLSDITIPPSVELIDSFAFSNTNIEKINLPSSVKVINKYAFSKCKKLTSFIAPEDLNVIEKFAFEGCENLKNVVLNDNLDFIHSKAFKETIIETVEIPKFTKYYSDTFPKFTIIKNKDNKEIER